MFLHHDFILSIRKKYITAALKISYRQVRTSHLLVLLYLKHVWKQVFRSADIRHVFSSPQKQGPTYRKSEVNKQVKASEPQQATFSPHLVSFKHNSLSEPRRSTRLAEVFLSVKITGPAFKSTPLLFLLSALFSPIKALKVQSCSRLLRGLLISVSVGWLRLFCR